MKKTILAATLMASASVFAGGDYGSSFQTATPINGTLSGRITAGDMDFFKITLNSPTSVNILTSGDSDTFGSLFNSAGQLVASNDDAAGSLNFRIAQQLNPGVYFITVRLYNPNATGLYDLRVFGASGGTTPTDDHGNTSSNASVLAINGSSAGVLHAGDIDYFAVNVPQAGRLVVRSTGGTDTFGSLLSSSGQVMLTNDDTNGINFELNQEVDAGRYFVAVRHYNATSGTGSYGLTASFTPTAALSAPTLIAPLATTVNPNAGTTFNWSTVAGAVGYRLVVSSDANFAGYSASTTSCNSTCLVVTTTSPSYYKSSFALAGQAYVWRVQAVNGTNSSAWSRTGAFSTSGSATLPAVNFASSAYRASNLFWQAGYAPARFYIGSSKSSQLGSARGNCTWYAHGRLREAGFTIGLNSMSGNAGTWATAARNAGITVNSTPAIGAIAQSTPNRAGYNQYGHVAVVERLNNDGTILISESSFAPGTSWDFEYRTRTVASTHFNNYIHVRK